MLMVIELSIILVKKTPFTSILKDIQHEL